MSRTALTGLAPSWSLRAFALTLVLFAAIATAGAQSASACVAQPFSPSPLSNSFEGADGDQCDSDGLGPKRDWQNVIGQDGFVSTTDTPSTADTMYGSNNAGLVSGSTDENVPDSWNFTIGNLGAPKYDALAAYSFTDFSDKLFVDLAFVRAASSGATFLAFELNQAQPGYRLDANESDPTKPFSVPTRSRGDLLVTYNVSTQGAIALGLCVWDGNEHTGRWEVFTQDLTGAAITNQTCPALSSTLYQAALNDAQGGRQGDIPAAENYVGSGIIGEGRFGEAVVNLTDALRDPSNANGPQPCIDFGYVWMHSRSSDSLTSSQQDFILPSKPVSIGNCSVEGKKFNDANGDGDNDGAGAGEPFLGGWTMFVDYDGDGVLDNNKDATFVNDMDGIVEAGEEEPYDVTSDGTDGRRRSALPDHRRPEQRRRTRRHVAGPRGPEVRVGLHRGDRRRRRGHLPGAHRHRSRHRARLPARVDEQRGLHRPRLRQQAPARDAEGHQARRHRRRRHARRRRTGRCTSPAAPPRSPAARRPAPRPATSTRSPTARATPSARPAARRATPRASPATATRAATSPLRPARRRSARSRTTTSRRR